MFTALPLTVVAKLVGAPGTPPDRAAEQGEPRGVDVDERMRDAAALNGSVIDVPVDCERGQAVVTVARRHRLLQDRPGAGHVRRGHRRPVQIGEGVPPAPTS